MKNLARSLRDYCAIRLSEIRRVKGNDTLRRLLDIRCHVLLIRHETRLNKQRERRRVPYHSDSPESPIPIVKCSPIPNGYSRGLRVGLGELDCLEPRRL